MQGALGRTSPADYSPLQKFLHWTSAAIVIGLIVSGLYMVKRYAATDFDAITKQIFVAHKLTGFLLLCLVILRLGLRLFRGVPAPDVGLSRLERVASHTVHMLLYALLLLVPVIGWLGASAYGLRSVTGGLNLPELLPRNDDLGGQLFWWHGWAAILLGGLAGLHAGAALFHRLVRKDTVLQRMGWAPRQR